MIKFSQYECGSILSSGLYEINMDELIQSCKEAASASWNKLSWKPITYTDYAVNLEDQNSYTFTWS